MNHQVQKSRVKLLAVIEAASVTGPAKNLLAFCREARVHPFSNLPLVETMLATFTRRAACQYPNEFVAKAAEFGNRIKVIDERFRFDVRVIKEMRELAGFQAPDIIQTHNVKSHCVLRASGLWRNHKWVAFHHGYTTTDSKMRAYNHLDRWSLKAAHLVVTMNQAFAEQLESVGISRDKIRVVHNAIDVKEISQVDVVGTSELKECLKIRDEDRVIIVVGRLSQEKGHIDLIRAYARMRSTRIDLRTKLVIVGDGPERERLERETVALGLENLVVFAGQVPNVKPYYALADLAVLPSHSEGSPNALLEAMAACVPVVATAVGGVPEIAADHETALLVEARNTDALAQAMSKLLLDSKLAARLASKAFAHVKDKYSPAARLQALLSIYSELVSDGALCETQFA